MNKWISVKDQLPEKHTNVLCNVKNEKGFDVQIVLTREDKTHDGIEGWLANFMFRSRYDENNPEYPEVPKKYITHWMSLPEPPK
jgi:hypothetical protein